MTGKSDRSVTGCNGKTIRVAVNAAMLAIFLALTACGSEPKLFDSGDETPARINAKLGLSYMQQGDFDVALEKLQRALHQNPDLPEAHHYLAELYRQLGNHELAEQHYRRALKLSPNDPALQNNYGVFLCGRGRYEEAEERFLRASRVSSYKRPDEAFQNAALCALREDDTGQAEKYFRKALDVNPMLPNALYQMARLSYESGEYLHARAFIQRYASAAPHTPQSLLLAWRIERKLGDDQAVRKYARQLRENFPESKETAELGESDG